MSFATLITIQLLLDLRQQQGRAGIARGGGPHAALGTHARCEQVEQVGRQREVVCGLLAREFADHVDGAGHDGGRLVREPPLQVVKRESQALRESSGGPRKKSGWGAAGGAHGGAQLACGYWR